VSDDEDDSITGLASVGTKVALVKHMDQRKESLRLRVELSAFRRKESSLLVTDSKEAKILSATLSFVTSA
jgi:hypothetical protein